MTARWAETHHARPTHANFLHMANVMVETADDGSPEPCHHASSPFPAHLCHAWQEGRGHRARHRYRCRYGQEGQAGERHEIPRDLPEPVTASAGGHRSPGAQGGAGPRRSPAASSSSAALAGPDPARPVQPPHTAPSPAWCSGASRYPRSRVAAPTAGSLRRYPSPARRPPQRRRWGSRRIPAGSPLRLPGGYF